MKKELSNVARLIVLCSLYTYGNIYSIDDWNDIRERQAAREAQRFLQEYDRQDELSRATERKLSRLVSKRRAEERLDYCMAMTLQQEEILQVTREELKNINSKLTDVETKKKKIQSSLGEIEASRKRVIEEQNMLNELKKNIAGLIAKRKTLRRELQRKEEEKNDILAQEENINKNISQHFKDLVQYNREYLAAAENKFHSMAEYWYSLAGATLSSMSSDEQKLELLKNQEGLLNQQISEIKDRLKTRTVQTKRLWKKVMGEKYQESNHPEEKIQAKKTEIEKELKKLNRRLKRCMEKLKGAERTYDELQKEESSKIRLLLFGKQEKRQYETEREQVKRRLLTINSESPYIRHVDLSNQNPTGRVNEARVVEFRDDNENEGGTSAVEPMHLEEENPQPLINAQSQQLATEEGFSVEAMVGQIIAGGTYSANQARDLIRGLEISPIIAQDFIDRWSCLFGKWEDQALFTALKLISVGLEVDHWTISCVDLEKEDIFVIRNKILELFHGNADAVLDAIARLDDGTIGCFDLKLRTIFAVTKKTGNIFSDLINVVTNPDSLLQEVFLREDISGDEIFAQFSNGSKISSDSERAIREGNQYAGEIFLRAMEVLCGCGNMNDIYRYFNRDNTQEDENITLMKAGLSDWVAFTDDPKKSADANAAARRKKAADMIAVAYGQISGNCYQNIRTSFDNNGRGICGTVGYPRATPKYVFRAMEKAIDMLGRVDVDDDIKADYKEVIAQSLGYIIQGTNHCHAGVTAGFDLAAQTFLGRENLASVPLCNLIKAIEMRVTSDFLDRIFKYSVFKKAENGGEYSFPDNVPGEWMLDAGFGEVYYDGTKIDAYPESVMGQKYAKRILGGHFGLPSISDRSFESGLSFLKFLTIHLLSCLKSSSADEVVRCAVEGLCSSSNAIVKAYGDLLVKEGPFDPEAWTRQFGQMHEGEYDELIRTMFISVIKNTNLVLKYVTEDLLFEHALEKYLDQFGRDIRLGHMVALDGDKNEIERLKIKFAAAMFQGAGLLDMQQPTSVPRRIVIGNGNYRPSRLQQRVVNRGRAGVNEQFPRRLTPEIEGMFTPVRHPNGSPQQIGGHWENVDDATAEREFYRDRWLQGRRGEQSQLWQPLLRQPCTPSVINPPRVIAAQNRQNNHQGTMRPQPQQPPSLWRRFCNFVRSIFS
ncbi:MAG: hypothetical protein LBQ08_04155 [Holosporaceae bacterium]|jgi:hypothetical protein|nr:hypothetical protein [Holosporaceae bacterium]